MIPPRPLRQTVPGQELLPRRTVRVERELHAREAEKD